MAVLRSSSGSLAMLAAMRRASPRVSSPLTDLGKNLARLMRWLATTQGNRQRTCSLVPLAL